MSRDHLQRVERWGERYLAGRKGGAGTSEPRLASGSFPAGARSPSSRTSPAVPTPSGTRRRCRRGRHQCSVLQNDTGVGLLECSGHSGRRPNANACSNPWLCTLHWGLCSSSRQDRAWRPGAPPDSGLETTHRTCWMCYGEFRAEASRGPVWRHLLSWDGSRPVPWAKRQHRTKRNQPCCPNGGPTDVQEPGEGQQDCGRRQEGRL